VHACSRILLDLGTHGKDKERHMHTYIHAALAVVNPKKNAKHRGGRNCE
jgi:hypothetical protein